MTHCPCNECNGVYPDPPGPCGRYPDCDTCPVVECSGIYAEHIWGTLSAVTKPCVHKTCVWPTCSEEPCP